ncbi:MAG: glycosyltransferase, partial [Candidatus Hydrogenedentes bacterium]|nr:glycosyltransferase [Candidatus Hydrogenedentota bacterium]
MKLCVVIPACNEEATLEPLAEGIASVLADQEYRILFIDDGSTDGSYAAMLRSREKNPRI